MPKSIGKYEILNTLGSGAMGVVYQARDPVIDRVVAIKVLSPALLENPKQRERFYQEARTAGNLRHPNVVVIYDCGEHEGIPFIVMEFLEGEDLRDLIARRVDWSLERKLDVALQICRGLKHAHEKGIIHRDMKPGNIRVLPDGTLRILDFGIARLADAAQTQTSSLMGTVSYMAPEQCLSGQATAATDIWAVGVILYELLSGHRPFEAAHNVAVIHKIVSEDAVPLGIHWPGCPKPLEQIVAKAVNKDVKKRYEDVDQLRNDLETFLRDASAAGEETLFSGIPRAGQPASPPASGSVLTESLWPQSPMPEATQQFPDPDADTLLISPPEASPEAVPRAAESPTLPIQPKPAAAVVTGPGRPGIPPPPPAPRAGHRWLLWAAPVFALAVVLVAWLLLSPKTEPTRDASGLKTPKPGAERVIETTEIPVSPSPRPVTLNILPWAEIIEARDKQGHVVESLKGRVTPVRLSMPPGAYSLQLRNRDVAAQDMSLTIEVPREGPAAVSQAFPGFNAEQAAASFR